MSTYDTQNWAESLALCLHEHAVPEEERALAYEASDAGERAWIKEHIAFLHALWRGRCDKERLLQRKLPGERQTLFSATAADWLVVLLAKNFSSAPELTAAVMPALLAGVPHVLFLQLSDGQSGRVFAPVVLTALDLLGQEDIFTITAEQLSEALKGSPPLWRRGRMLGLGFASPGDMRHIIESFWPPEAECQVFTACTPSFGVCEKAKTSVDFAKLAWAHPSSTVCALSGTSKDAGLTPIVSNPTENAVYLAKFAFTPGQENLWVWPGLNPDFFVNSSLIIAGNNSQKE